MAAIKKEDVLTYLENANMLEISELIKDIEDKFGVTAAAPVAIAGGAASAAGDAGADEEKSEFDIELTGVGDKKINVIKVIRTITSLGLKEAKDLVEATTRKGDHHIETPCMACLDGHYVINGRKVHELVKE